MPEPEIERGDPQPSAAATAPASSAPAIPTGIAVDLAERGFSVQPHFWSAQEIQALAGESRALWQQGAFRHAGVGRGPSFRMRPQVRNDRVFWIDPSEPSAMQRHFLERMEALRCALNRSLYLGLFGFEAHLTVYPPGAYYRTHRDQFADAAHRILSCITYLNEGWEAKDGGALRLYLGGEPTGACADIAPRAGTFVVFFSERLYHEVLPAARERCSITGWFTRRR